MSISIPTGLVQPTATGRASAFVEDAAGLAAHAPDALDTSDPTLIVVHTNGQPPAELGQ
jgi:hypothetical protein